MRRNSALVDDMSLLDDGFLTADNIGSTSPTNNEPLLDVSSGDTSAADSIAITTDDHLVDDDGQLTTQITDIDHTVPQSTDAHVSSKQLIGGISASTESAAASAGSVVGSYSDNGAERVADGSDISTELKGKEIGRYSIY